MRADMSRMSDDLQKMSGELAEMNAFLAAQLKRTKLVRGLS